jgi:hypothetical protein
MLRSSLSRHSRRVNKVRSTSKLLSTQSSGDAQPATALATLYLEDGTTIVGKSFGCHESIEGEVSKVFQKLHCFYAK